MSKEEKLKFWDEESFRPGEPQARALQVASRPHIEGELETLGFRNLAVAVITQAIRDANNRSACNKEINSDALDFLLTDRLEKYIDYFMLNLDADNIKSRFLRQKDKAIKRNFVSH